MAKETDALKAALSEQPLDFEYKGCKEMLRLCLKEVKLDAELFVCYVCGCSIKKIQSELKKTYKEIKKHCKTCPTCKKEEEAWKIWLKEKNVKYAAKKYPADTNCGK